MLKKIVSGGQTGVDRAALDVALSLSSELGIIPGGYCPKGRIAEDGIIDLKYPLIETPSSRYPQRTQWNVEKSDATLILYRDKLTGGTALTLKLAKEKSKQYFLVDLNQITNSTYKQAIDWIKENQISTLNVAGSRESTSPGIYKQAHSFLEKLLRKQK